MLRSIIAVLVGYLALALIVGLGVTAAAIATLGTAAPSPAIQLTPTYLAANLAVSFLGAVVGGFVAARLARTSQFMHAAFLAGILVILGLITALTGGQTALGQPLWYGWTIPLVGGLGALLGGWLHTRLV